MGETKELNESNKAKGEQKQLALSKGKLWKHSDLPLSKQTIAAIV